jgi:hypothetical protein
MLLRLVHASIGMNTEQAEFADALKKHLYYGKSLDRTNLLEELGDQLWYIGIALDVLNSSFDEIMEMNINKLKARYGDKFNEEGALSRNLQREGDALSQDAKKSYIHYAKIGIKPALCGKNANMVTIQDIKEVTCPDCLSKFSLELDNNTSIICFAEPCGYPKAVCGSENSTSRDNEKVTCEKCLEKLAFGEVDTRR